MERVFLRNVTRENGTIRWRNGQIVDYPVGTWGGIAEALGVDLEEFSKDASVAASEHARAQTAAILQPPAKADDDGGSNPDSELDPESTTENATADAPDDVPAAAVVSARTSKASAPATA